MSPAERVAAAIAAGECSRREGESLLGFLGLVDVVEPGQVLGALWDRSTFFRRQRLARSLGLELG